MLEKINEVYSSTKIYPELVTKLIALGVESYTVDVTTDVALYRFPNGQTVVKHSDNAYRVPDLHFSADAVKEAIRIHQLGQTDYERFMQDIADAGVRFYEATLTGERRRVAYIGIDGVHEEIILL